MNFPVLKAFITSFVYFFSHLSETIKINWLPLLVMQVAMVLIMPQYMEYTIQMQSVNASADPSEVFSTMGPMLKWLGMLYLVMAIIYPMLFAGNLRPLIRGESTSSPFYFRFGGDEFRILMTFILLFILLTICYVVGILVFIIAGGVVSLISPAIGAVVMGLGALVFLIALIWFSLRMSLVFAATIATKKIGIPESWRITKGHSWGLFFYWLLWMLVFLGIFSIYAVVVMPEYFGLIGDLISAGQDVSAQAEMNTKLFEWQKNAWDMSGPNGWKTAIGSYLYMILAFSLWNISGGMAYRYLTDIRDTE